MLIALDFHLGPVREVAVIGARDFEGTAKVLAALQSNYHPRQLIAFHDPAEGEPPSDIAFLRGKTGTPNDVVTYICQNYVCAAPIVGAAAAIKVLT